MSTRFRPTVAALALGMVAVTAVACTGSHDKAAADSVTAPPFALTSADVFFVEGRDYPINLIFVADDDDPIWTRLTGMAVSDDVTYGPGQFEVIRGDGRDRSHLGTLTFELALPSSGMSFESVDLFYSDLREPVTVDVGSWALQSLPSTEFATAEVGEEVAAISDCARAALPVPTTATAVEGFRTGSSFVAVDSAELEPEQSSISVSLTCSGDLDFYVISPAFDYVDSAGSRQGTRLAPIAIGFQDIEDADYERIAER